MDQGELNLDLIEGTPTFVQYQTGYNCAVGGLTWEDKWHEKCDGSKCDCRCHFRLLSNGKWRRLSEAEREAWLESRFLSSLGELVGRKDGQRKWQGDGKAMARRQ
jgi:hypothetical protein